MRIFLTGGSGYVGEAVVRELVAGGHRVTGLTRGGSGAARLRELGAGVVEGEIADAEALARAAADHDVAIHLAQDRGAGDRLAADRAALDALAAAVGPAGLVVYTSNAFLLGGRGEGPFHEDDPWPEPALWGAWRRQAEVHVLALAARGPATAVVRPGQVYGGAGGTIPMLFESAVRDGAAGYVGTGENRWSLVHRADLARLYRLVVERRATGVFHGVDGHPLMVGEIARAASEAAGAGGRTRSIPLEAARREMGDFAEMLALDVALGARRARALGWEPRHPSFTGSARAAFEEWREEGTGAI